MTHSREQPQQGVSTPATGNTLLSTVFSQGGRWIGVLVLVAYTAGLLTVNTYLYGIGISDFDLVKPRIVVSGILVLLFQLLVALLSLLVAVLLSRLPTKDPEDKTMLFAGIAFFGSMATLTTFVSLLSGEGLYSLGSSADVSVLYIALSWLSCMLWLVGLVELIGSTEDDFLQSNWSYILSKPIKRLGVREAKRRLTSVGLVCLSTLIAVTFLFNSVLFGAVFYDQIPEQFGGGEASSIKFVVLPQHMDAAKAVGLSLDGSTGRTATYQLLWESETQYVVLFQGDEKPIVAHVSKELFSAVLYVDRRPQLPDNPSSTPVSPAASPIA